MINLIFQSALPESQFPLAGLQVDAKCKKRRTLAAPAE
jgi:hypothetical protein